MNKERRKAIDELGERIRAAIAELGAIQSGIEDVMSEEQEYFDAMPESFQNGDKGQAAQAAIDALQNAYDALDVDLEGDVLGQLEEAAA